MASISTFKGSVVFVSFKLCVLLFVLISSLMHSAHGSDSSCGPCYFYELDHVCCNGECVLGSNCLGHSCSSSSDCFGDERCCGSTCKADPHCFGDSCKTNSDCGQSGSCCRSDRKCRASCIGAQCASDSDCGRNEYCCGGKCAAGPCSSCNTDSDCGGANGRCCQGRCHKSDHECIDQTAIFCGALGSIGLLSLLGCLCNCACLHKRLRRSACAEHKNLPPYPGRNRPSYHQTCSDYPPPEYEQQEGMVLQPYPPKTTRTHEAPPPYSTEPECTSGGTDVGYFSYGAVTVTAVQL